MSDAVAIGTGNREIVDPTDLRVPLRVTPSGDFDVVVGEASVRQSIRHLIVSSPGDLLHRPRWGSGVPDEQNEVADERLLARIRGRIREALESDSRVESVSRLGAKVSDDGVVEVDVWVVVSGVTLTYSGVRLQ